MMLLDSVKMFVGRQIRASYIQDDSIARHAVIRTVPALRCTLSSRCDDDITRCLAHLRTSGVVNGVFILHSMSHLVYLALSSSSPALGLSDIALVVMMCRRRYKRLLHGLCMNAWQG
jgi:hypothetical protein